MRRSKKLQVEDDRPMHAEKKVHKTVSSLYLGRTSFDVGGYCRWFRHFSLKRLPFFLNGFGATIMHAWYFCRLASGCDDLQTSFFVRTEKVFLQAVQRMLSRRISISNHDVVLVIREGRIIPRLANVVYLLSQNLFISYSAS